MLLKRIEHAHEGQNLPLRSLLKIVVANGQVIQSGGTNRSWHQLRAGIKGLSPAIENVFFNRQIVNAHSSAGDLADLSIGQLNRWRISCVIPQEEISSDGRVAAGAD